MKHKLNQLKESGVTDERVLQLVNEKECLCSGLGNSTLIKYKIKMVKGIQGVTICPGPNIAYFNRIFSLKEMVGHIYGKVNLLSEIKRPNIFVNELRLYIDHFSKLISDMPSLNQDKTRQYLNNFKTNLLAGINYYKDLAEKFCQLTNTSLIEFSLELKKAEVFLQSVSLVEVSLVA